MMPKFDQTHKDSPVADLESRLSDVVGDRTAKVLAASFGMATIDDLLRHYPRRYVVRGQLTDISQLSEGDEVTVLAVGLMAAIYWRRF
jgi:ATP-dependent DNA helicase RecG